MFYEIDMETAKRTWEAGGVFAPTDVHRQVLFSDRIHIMLFAGREVRIGKSCARGLEYGPRPRAKGCAQDRGHSFSQYGPT